MRSNFLERPIAVQRFGFNDQQISDLPRSARCERPDLQRQRRQMNLACTSNFWCPHAMRRAQRNPPLLEGSKITTRADSGSEGTQRSELKEIMERAIALVN